MTTRCRSPLGHLVGTRSGDKGGDANLGVFARHDAVWAWLDAFLTVDELRRCCPRPPDCAIERYRFPALRALELRDPRPAAGGCGRVDPPGRPGEEPRRVAAGAHRRAARAVLASAEHVPSVRTETRQVRFTDEHEQFRAMVRTYVEKEINPACRVGGRRGDAACTRCSPRWRALGPARPRVRTGVRRPGREPRVHDDPRRGDGPLRSRRAADGARRAGRHGDAVARPLRHARAEVAVPRPGDAAARWSRRSRSASPTPAPTSPAIRTRAVRDGDEWVINGTKTWITNSLQADWLCLLARTSDEGGYAGMSQIVVPTTTRRVLGGEDPRQAGHEGVRHGHAHLRRLPCPGGQHDR